MTVPIVPGPGEPEPPTQPTPPPQVVYVYQQPQQAGQVTKGIWDFVFQTWFVIGAIVVFFVVLCVGCVLATSIHPSQLY